jgi:hypothetical protein
MPELSTHAVANFGYADLRFLAQVYPVSDEYLAWSAKDSQSYIRPPIIGRAPAPPEAMFEVCSTGPAGKVGCSAVSFVRTLEPPQGEPHDFRTISGTH